MNASTQKIELYKVRSFGDLLGDTFIFTRQNFKQLFKGLFYIASPVLLLSMVAYFFYFSRYMSLLNSAKTGDLFYISSNAGGILGAVLLLMLAMFVSVTLITCVTFSYIKHYRESKEQEITVSMLWKDTKQYFWKIIGAQLLVAVAMFAFILVFSLLLVGIANSVASVGIVFLLLLIILPLVLYYSIRFSFVPFFIIVGDFGVINSFGDSYNFTQGIFWKTLGFLFVLTLLIMLVSYLFALPGALLMVIGTVSGIVKGAAADANSGLMLVSNVFNSVASVISYMLYALLFIGQGVLYFSEIEKEQGVNMQKQIDEIGKNEE